MSQELGILLTAKLRDDQSAINSLNRQVEVLSTKMDKLSLGIDVKLIEQQLGMIQKFTSNFSKNFKLYDSQELEKNNVKIITSLKQAKEEYSKLGEVKVNSTSFNELTKKMEGFTLQVTKADGVVEKLKFDLANIAAANGKDINEGFILKTSSITDNSQKIAEKQLQDKQKLEKQLQEESIKRENEAAQQREKNLQEEQKIRRAIQKEQQAFYDEQDKYFRKADTLDSNALIPQDRVAEFRRMIAGTSNTDGIKEVNLEYGKLLDVQAQIVLENRQLDQMEKARLDTIKRQVDEERKLNEEQAKAINKALEDKYKATQTEDLRVKRLGDNVRVTDVSTTELTEREALTQRLKQVYAQLNDGIKEQDVEIQKINKRWIDNERYVLEANVQIKNGKSEILQYKAAIDSTTHSIRDQGAEFKDNSNRNLGMLEQFKIALTRVPIWLGATTAIFGTKAMLESMLQTIIQIDSNMIDLQKVMNSDTNFDHMLQSSLDIANQLGNKLDDIQKAMIGFAQAGFNEQDTVALAKVSTIMSNISELSPDQSMSTLTSAMVQFKLSTEDAITVADKLNKVSNDFPVTFANLAQAIERSGSSATTFGVSMEKMIGDITAIGSVTRESGHIVGNSLEIIYSRIGTMKQSIDELNAIGIKTKEVNGDNRTATSILNDLHDQWNSLSNAQKQNLGISIAGRDQLSRFLALMNNYENGLKAATAATNSQGSAMQENDRHMQSLEAKINKLKNAWSELSLAVGNAALTDSFVAVLSALNGLAKAGVGVANTVGVLPVLFGAIGTAAILMSKRFREAAVSGKILEAGFTGLTISAETLKVALRTLLASTVVGVAFAAIGFVVEKLISSFAKASEESQKLQEHNDKSVESYSKNASEIDKLVGKYRELSDATNNGKSGNADQLKEYQTVQNQLNQLIPSLTDNIDKEGNAHLRNADAVKTEIDFIKRLTDNKREANALSFGDQFNNDQNNIDKAQKKVDGLKKTLDQMQTAFNNQGSVSPTKLANQEKTFNDLTFQLINAENELQKFKKTSDDSIKSFASNMRSFGDVKIDNAIKDAVGSIDFSKLGKNDIQSLIVNIDKASKSVNNFSDSTQADKAAKQQYVDELGKLFTVAGALPDKVNQIKAAFNSSSGSIANTAQSITDLSQRNIDLTDSFFTVQDEVKPLNDALDKMASGHDLTSSEINNLVKTYPNLIKAMQVENGQLKINVDAIKAERDTKVGSFNQTLQAYKLEVQAHEQKVREDLRLYGQEIQAIETVAQARQAAADAADAATAGGSDAGIRNRVYSKYSAELEAIVNAKDQIKSLEGAVSAGFNFDTTNDNVSKAKEVVDAYTKSIAELDLALERLKYELGQYPKSSQQYRDGLQKEIDLIQKKISLTEQQLTLNGKANQAVSVSPVSGFGSGVNPYADQKAAQIGLTKTSGYRSPQESIAVGGHANDDHTKGLAEDFAGSVDKMNEFAKWATSSGLFSKVLWQGKDQIQGYAVDGHYDHVHVSWNQPDANMQLPSGVAKEDFDKLNKNQQDLIKFRDELAKLNQELVNSKIAEFDNQLSQLDIRLKISESVMGGLNKSSQQYRDEIALQVDLLKQKESAVSQEADMIRKSGISTDELNSKLGQLTTSWWEYKKAIDALNIANLESQLAGLDEKLSDVDFQLKLSDLSMSHYEKTSQSYRDELVKQINLMKQKEAITKQEIEAIKASGITTDEMKDKVKQLNSTLLDLQTTRENLIDNFKKQNADSIIEMYKQVYEKQRDAELDALDKRNKAEQKRHDAEMKRLDDEMSKFEESINQQQKLIDQQAQQEDWQKQLAKAQKERADIQKQIDVLALDNSIEAKAKREDLQKQLGEKDQSIEDMQTTHARELRKQNLQDQLDAYKKDIDAKKQAEDEKYKAAQDAAQNERETIQRKYDNMLNDERNFANLRKDILEGNIGDINKDFESFTKFLSDHASLLGESITTNLIDKIKELKAELGTLQNVGSNPFGMSPDDFNKYLNNKQDFGNQTPEEQQRRREENQRLRDQYGVGQDNYSYEDLIRMGNSNNNNQPIYNQPPSTNNSDAVKQEMARNSEEWHSASEERKRWLEQKNQELGHSIGGIYDSNTGTWTFDEGGFVGDAAPSKIASIFNKLFNDKPDRRVVQSLLGELQVPPKNLPNMVESMKMMISNITPTVQMAGGGGDTYQVNLYVDNLNGTKQDANMMLSQILTGMKTRGKKI